MTINWPTPEMQGVGKEVHIDFYLPFSGLSEVSRVIALISAEMRPFVVVRVYPGNHCSNNYFRGTLFFYTLLNLLDAFSAHSGLNWPSELLYRLGRQLSGIFLLQVG